MRKQTWWYAGLCIGLIALATYTLRQPAERGMVRMRLGPVAMGDVDRIEIRGSAEATLHKEGGTWRITSGRAADTDAIERLIHNIDETELTDFVTDEEEEFTELGVRGPKALEIALLRGGRVLRRFAVTQADAPGMATTVLMDGRVFRGESPLGMLGARSESEWLDRHLFDLPSAEVASMQISLNDEAPYTLERSLQEEAGWTLTDKQLPKRFRFDASAADNLLNILTMTQLERFVDVQPDANTTGLTGPTVESWCLAGRTGQGAEGSGRSECLLVGRANDANQRYAKMGHRDDIFLLPDSQVAALRRHRGDLRALNMMASVNVDDATEAGFERPGSKPMRFVRGEGGWRIQSGQPSANFALDGQKLNARLKKMTFARAVGIADAGEARMKPTNGRLWVKTKDGKEHALVVGAPIGGKDGMRHYFARGTADQNTYRMSKPLYDDLFGNAETIARATGGNKAQARQGDGLDGLPPEVRANLERQLAQQKQQG